MSLDDQHIERISASLDQQWEQGIEHLTKQQLAEAEALQYASSPEGMFAVAGLRLSRSLDEGLNLERQRARDAQKKRWRRIILHRKPEEIESPILSSDHNLTEPCTEDNPLKYRGKKRPQTVSNIGVVAEGTWIADGRSEEPGRVFKLGWLLLCSEVPHWDPRSASYLLEASAKDLDIYRYSKETYSGQQDMTLVFHSRTHRERLKTFWAYEDGERLDDMVAIGRGALDTAHGLVHTAQANLDAYLTNLTSK